MTPASGFAAAAAFDSHMGEFVAFVGLIVVASVVTVYVVAAFWDASDRDESEAERQADALARLRRRE